REHGAAGATTAGRGLFLPPPGHGSSYATNAYGGGGLRHPPDPAESQCRTAPSAPTPVRDRTSLSAHLAGSSVCFAVRVTTAPTRKASGIDTMPGFDSGHHAKCASGNIEVGDPDTPARTR